MAELWTPDGRSIDVDWGWLDGALLSWISDPSVVDCAVKAGTCNPVRVGHVKRLLQAKMAGKRSLMGTNDVKRTAYELLGDRNTRKRIARSILRETERQTDQWAKEVDRWLRTPEGHDPGPKPERPERHDLKELVEELKGLREKLAKELRVEAPMAQPAGDRVPGD
jgi:hypothetical protein